MTDSGKRKFLLLGYGDNPSTPGRFLADGLTAIQQEIKICHDTIDLAKVDLARCFGVVIVDCPSRPPVQLRNWQLAKNLPKIFWTYHGKHILNQNIQLVKMYHADLVLMSSCLDLAKKFPVPVAFFPLAVPVNFFTGGPPLKQREIDLSFVGNNKGPLYVNRKESLKMIQRNFPDRKIMFTKGVYLSDLAALYQQSKLVYNDSVNQTMTLRIFEGIGARSLVVSDSLPEQDQILAPDKHYVRYLNEADKLRKIRHYLHETAAAQIIADRGFHWVMKHHTFAIRAAQLLEILSRSKLPNYAFQ